MKRIGLIGGIGWASTIEYYRYLNQFTGQEFGKEHSANLMLINLDSGVIRVLAEKNDEEAIYTLFLNAAKTLQSAGAELLVLGANGAHRFCEQLKEEIHIPIVHIVEATASVVKKANLKKVALLGVRRTMEGTFYKDILAKHGIEAVVPDLEDRNFIDRTIYDELMDEKFLPATKRRYVDIIQGLIKQGAQGVILGCTEIPLLIKQADLEIPVFPTSEIHCRAIIQAAK